MSHEQRTSPENGIWLCAECADRVDKTENESRYPVELLRAWKEFHESTTGTDFASIRDRVAYPVRKLTLIDFGGVQGEISITFGALTIFHGTSKLNRTIGELLRIFSDRQHFVRTRQPGNEPNSDLRIPIAEDKALVIRFESKHGKFPSRGKMKLCLSDNKEVIISAGKKDIEMSIGDSKLPVFSSVINVISIGSNFNHTVLGPRFSDAKPNILKGLSEFFEISKGELINCIKGVPTDSSVFGYLYEIRNDMELYLRVRNNDDFYPLGVLSGGEKNRFVLDMAVKIARYSAKAKPTLLAIDQSNIISLDQNGWAFFLEWVEKSKLPFQVVVDRCYRPSEGNLSHAICYEVVGSDMEVSSFKQMTWHEFKK